MKTLSACLFASALGLALAGCAQINGAIESAANAVNSTAATINSAPVQQAVASLTAATATLACVFADGASLAGAVAASEDNGTVKSAQIVERDATSVYVASSAVCADMGGTVVKATPAS